MEPIHYFILYLLGLITSLVFYYWLNGQPVPKEARMSFGFAVFMSILWPFILATIFIYYPFEQLGKLWSTVQWQRFTNWYERN